MDNKKIKKELKRNNPTETAWQISDSVFNCVIKIGKEIIKKKCVNMRDIK